MATVKKRGKSYLIRAYDGYDSNGKQIERTMTWTPPDGMSEAKIKKELERVKVHFEDEIKNGIYSNKRVKFSDFAEKWFAEYAEKQLAPKTVSGYREQLPRINEHIGHLYLDKIRPSRLIKMRDDLLKTPLRNKYYFKGNLKAVLKTYGFQTLVSFSVKAEVSLDILKYLSTGHSTSEASAKKIASALGCNVTALFDIEPCGTLSANSVRHYLHLVSSILSTAVDWQYIPANPMDRVSIPSVDSTQQTCLSQEQAIHLLELLQDVPIKYRTAVTVLLFTGMRREELLALHWSDINLDTHLVYIQGSLQYIPGKGLVHGKTKTEASNRIIKISKNAILSLSAFKEYQKQQYQTLAVDWDEQALVFADPTGSVMRPNTLTAWFHRFIKKTDLPPIHIHSLRHTTATLLIEKNTPLTAIAGSLGHARPSVTTTIYAHALKAASAMAADAMDDIIAGY